MFDINFFDDFDSNFATGTTYSNHIDSSSTESNGVNH